MLSANLHSEIINLPPGVQPPRFQLFQKVQVKGKIAVVSGLYYSDFNTAITEQTGYVGWNYKVNYVMDKSKEELLNLINTEATDDLCEWQVEELGVEPIDREFSVEVS